MIKKTITVLSMLILSAALMWAIWEGNAAAGSQEDFPSGLFASSDLFPKYTLIEITNLEQNTTSRAVVIGDMGSDGLLVKVSPDVAKALSIKEGSIARVRVSVPPLVAEEGADPVLLGKVEEKQPVPTATPAKPAKENSQSIPAEEPVQTETEEPISPIAEVEEPAQPEPIPEEPMSPIAEVEEPVQPEPEIVPAPAAVSEVPEPAVFSASSEYSAEAEKPVPDAPPMQEPPMQEGSESSGEYTKPVLQVSEIAIPETAPELNEFLSPVPEVSTPIEPEPVMVDEAKPEKDEEEPVAEPELLAVEPTEEQAEETEELQDEPEVVVAQETAVEKELENNTTENELMTENHVMLVPSEPREPVREYIPVPKEPEKPAVPVGPVVTQPAEELYTANVLTKGSFYVQVGRFKDILNVESFVQMYGKEYPVAIEKSSTAKDVFYKVYIGPLKKDERGAALETFQKLGFKDAFLKKAP
ncbi:SPOR domain-containing protein [Treponema medium]|uniref:SPOR domain-containing protein n=1 Tax=Treponema medium TaxID=58231 RepID=UPI001981BB18|nr:SPOR domain-containing protein [Treponema medium]QSH93048.1 SPOR domain-containing protein [Treponema medium]